MKEYNPINCETNLGEMSQPWRMKAPNENQSELKIPNSLVDSVVSGRAPSSGSSSVHSYGLNLDTCSEATLEHQEIYFGQ